jgi:hypothetical protein
MSNKTYNEALEEVIKIKINKNPFNNLIKQTRK